MAIETIWRCLANLKYLTFTDQAHEFGVHAKDPRASQPEVLPQLKTVETLLIKKHENLSQPRRRRGEVPARTPETATYINFAERSTSKFRRTFNARGVRITQCSEVVTNVDLRERHEQVRRRGNSQASRR